MCEWPRQPQGQVQRRSQSRQRSSAVIERIPEDLWHARSAGKWRATQFPVLPRLGAHLAHKGGIELPRDGARRKVVVDELLESCVLFDELPVHRSGSHVQGRRRLRDSANMLTTWGA